MVADATAGLERIWLIRAWQNLEFNKATRLWQGEFHDWVRMLWYSREWYSTNADTPVGGWAKETTFDVITIPKTGMLSSPDKNLPGCCGAASQWAIGLRFVSGLRRMNVRMTSPGAPKQSAYGGGYRHDWLQPALCHLPSPCELPPNRWGVGVSLLEALRSASEGGVGLAG